jgi:hypothetical protein
MRNRLPPSHIARAAFDCIRFGGSGEDTDRYLPPKDFPLDGCWADFLGF